MYALQRVLAFPGILYLPQRDEDKDVIKPGNDLIVIGRFLGKREMSGQSGSSTKGSNEGERRVCMDLQIREHFHLQPIEVFVSSAWKARKAFTGEVYFTGNPFCVRKRSQEWLNYQPQ